MEKYQSSLEKAKERIRSADYMIHTTYPTIKDSKFFIKIFEELHESLLNVVKAILQYEYLYKRIQLYSEAQSNFETFTECAVKYKIPPKEVSDVRDMFLIMKKHKESPMEFTRKEKFIIMSDDLRTDALTLEILNNYLAIAKDILGKAETVTSQKA